MAKLFITPLGSSCRSKFCDELQALEYGVGAIVLPNRFVMDDVRRRYTNVEAIGIDTLATKLLNMNGYVTFHQINRRSQELIVEDFLHTLAEQKQLDYFGELVEKPGFVKAMTSLVGQLSRSGSTQEQIISALQNWGRSGQLGQKDKEVALLYKFYRYYLKSKQWFDLEGKYRLALYVLQNEKAKLPWQQLYFCDFYSFDALQLELIKALSKRCRVQIGLCYEKNLEKTEREKLFGATRTTYLELESLCLEEGIEQYAPKQETSVGCAHLVQGLGLKHAPLHQSDDVQLYCFTQREQELRYALTQVKQLLKRGIAADKILITLRDMNQFTGLRLIADEYGVPINLAQTSSLAVQPLTELMLLSLKAAVDNHDGAEAYIKLLTAPLARLLLQIDGESINNLRQDNYFKSRSAVQQKMREYGLTDSVVELVDAFSQQLAPKADIVTYGKQMLELVEQLQLEKTLGSLYQAGKLELAGLRLVLQSKSLFMRAVQQLMEDYVNCGQGEKALALNEWQQILADAVQEPSLVLQSGRPDGILITEVTNVQGLEFDYVFVLGLREGVFPKVNNENWIYNDKERKELAEAGLELPNTSLAHAEDAGFFGAAIGCARKQLVLSYFQDNQAGASAYMGSVQRLFIDAKPRINSKGEEEEQEQQVVINPTKACASAEELSQGPRLTTDAWLREYWGEHTLAAAEADYQRKDNMLYNGVLTDAALQKQVAKNVGTSFSASALELYAACPFQYLGQRVWRQQEFAALEDELTAADEGDLLHQVLAGFTEKHLHAKICKLPLVDLEQEIEEIFDKAAQEALEQGKIVNSLLWQGEAPRLLNMLKRWLRYEHEDQKQWSFTPCAVEWDFSSKNGKPLPLRLSDGTRVTLNGRLDRIDSDGQRLFITDYKRSASSVPSGKDLATGFDVQLPLYILAAAGLYKNAGSVAGAAYFILKDGERQSFLLEQVDNKNIKDSKKYTKEISQSWASFQGFAQKLIAGYIEGIYAGNFAVAPRKSCSDYCQLKDICRLAQVGQAKGGSINE
ncbi:MAG: PD-(D/E)XK nuclease family protein [Phascolarctobacterium sp.]